MTRQASAGHSGSFLSDLGHEVDVASSAEEGLDLAAQEPLDAVMLDVRLPGIDGLSALGQFRELAGPAPIIVITGVWAIWTPQSGRDQSSARRADGRR